MIIKIDEQKKYAIASSRIRSERDALLVESDWRVLPNRPDASLWETYRQALRDITQQQGFPYSVTWPAKPQ